MRQERDSRLQSRESLVHMQGGEQKKESDLDIIVKFYKGATLFDLVGLADYLEEKLKVKVDIVPDDTIREEIKKEVLKETVFI